jgi:hypothetical protein
MNQLLLPQCNLAYSPRLWSQRENNSGVEPITLNSNQLTIKSNSQGDESQSKWLGSVYQTTAVNFNGRFTSIPP